MYTHLIVIQQYNDDNQLYFLIKVYLNNFLKEKSTPSDDNKDDYFCNQYLIITNTNKI